MPSPPQAALLPTSYNAFWQLTQRIRGITLRGRRGGLGIAAAGGADRRSAKNAAAPRAALRLLQVVADYKRVNAVLGAGHAGRGGASGPQYPGVSAGRAR